MNIYFFVKNNSQCVKREQGKNIGAAINVHIDDEHDNKRIGGEDFSNFGVDIPQQLSDNQDDIDAEV